MRFDIKENYETIQKACLNKKSISFKTKWNPTSIHNVIPYKISSGSEELFNYVLCAEYNELTIKQEAIPYRLSRIENIFFTQLECNIDNTVKYNLDKMIEYGPAYPINANEEVCVELTPTGINNYRKIYFGRPKYEYEKPVENGSLLFFNCSLEQLFFYFRRFGKEAKILYPDHFRKRMANFHAKANDLYTDNNKKNTVM